MKRIGIALALGAALLLPLAAWPRGHAAGYRHRYAGSRRHGGAGKRGR